jgi:hypothetical protein
MTAPVRGGGSVGRSATRMLARPAMGVAPARPRGRGDGDPAGGFMKLDSKAPGFGPPLPPW